MRTEVDVLARSAAGLRNYIGLVVAYARLNLNAQLEYRAAFISQVAAMFVNDGVWVAFWGLFFTRFPVLQGWTIKDVITIWAITAAGFGLAYAVFGNALELARLIAQGQLDVWMLYPRELLSHLLLGRMNATAWGDMLFGYVVYIGFVQPDLTHFLMFAGLSLSVALLFVGFAIASGSLSFFLGNAIGLAEQWHFALTTFSTYPSILFEGAVKLLLYTLIPAGFVSYVPLEALHRLSLGYAGLALAGSAVVSAGGIIMFYFGLRRYESGNLTEMRG
jgi:ABC-2 type transport system permease protein